MKKIIYLGLFLAFVSSIVTFALAATNQVTAPIIAEIEKANLQASLRSVFPEGETFKTVATREELEAPTIEVIKALDSNNNHLGYIYQQKVRGYAGDVSYLIGIDMYGYYNNFIVLSSMETPGFGSRIETDEWTSKVIGTHSSEEIDILTRATVTTSPIVAAMEIAHKDFITRVEMEANENGA